MLQRHLTGAACKPSWPFLRPVVAPQAGLPQAGLSRGLFLLRASADAPSAAPEDPPRGARTGTKLTVLNRYRALVLDSTYQPIDVVNWQRAICLEIATKVDVLEYYEDVTVKAPSDEFLVPAVVRVRYFSKRGAKNVRVALNRNNIFLRDNFQCQYCGAEQHLTIDHVVPCCLGGGNTWENLVTCCSKCNSHKGSKTLKELRWKLRNKPKEPSPHEVTMMMAKWTGQPLDKLPPQWDTYLQPMMARQQSRKKARKAQDQEPAAAAAAATAQL